MGLSYVENWIVELVSSEMAFIHSKLGNDIEEININSDIAKLKYLAKF